MAFFRVSSGGTANYRITITIAAYKADGWYAEATAAWVYEIRDGQISYVSGSNPVYSYSKEQTGKVYLGATIKSVTIEEIE